MSRHDTLIPMLLLLPAYRLCSRHIRPRASLQKVLHQSAIPLQYSARRWSTSMACACVTKLSTPMYTKIDNIIVILVVRCLVGKARDAGILRCSDTCQP